MTWRPKKETTKTENVILKHARDYNHLTRNLSILNTSTLGECDEDR